MLNDTDFQMQFLCPYALHVYWHIVFELMFARLLNGSAALVKTANYFNLLGIVNYP